MAIGAFTPQQVGKPQQQSSKVHKYPAPIKGIDTRVSVSIGDPLHCIYTFNLVPYDYGMRVRQGYREAALDLDLGASVGVHTIVPFEGVIEDGSSDRLFAVTNEGIWDVTTFGVPPTIKATFLNQSADAGFGVYAHYVDGSGDDLMYYADSRNGLFVYDPVGDTWAQAAGITGPVITDVNFIVSHKQRLWLCEEGAQSAWYLDVGSNSGQATEFVFASKFKHGGALVGLYNWSVDGGDGVDDYLVAVSRAGDVLPFQGEDPASASTWNLVGTYYIGKVPRGPNFATEHGGEMFLLSSYGIVGMNDLLKGVNTVSGIIDPESNPMSAKIAGWLRERVLRTIDQFGWSVRVAPSDGSLIVNSVNEAGFAQLQFVYNISTGGWGQWREVPMLCFDNYKGFIAFGDTDNRVLYMDANIDNVQITPPIDRPNGDGIRFSVLTGYHGLDSDALYKQVKLIRPDFIAKAEPSFKCQARYDYNLSEIVPGSATVEANAEWDSGQWDVAVWGSDNFEGFTGLQGTWGTGRYIAVAMSGESRADTRFVGWDIIYSTGGPLR
jgi:hypothetical protein